MEYVALDFETANNEAGCGCAIGLVRFDEEGKEQDSFYSLIHPRIPYFDPWMTSVHQLDSRDCLKAPQFPELWPVLQDFIKGDLVVAHFAQFDMGVLRRTLQVYGLQSDPIRYVCTCNLGRKIWPNLPCYKLSYLVQYLDLADYHQHYALDDALMCGRVMYRECGSHLLDKDDLQRFLTTKRYVPKVLDLSRE